MDKLLQDIRFALRTLRKSPGFTLVAMLTLALGIGANTAIFSVVDAVLLRSLPFSDPDRLVVVWGHHEQIGRETASLPDYRDWREQTRSFEELAAGTQTAYTLTGAGEPERITGAWVTANYFDVLGEGATLGRTFLPGEDRAGGEQIALLSEGFWERRFGADPSIVGRSITLDGLPYAVVGVVPDRMPMGEPRDVFVPMDIDDESFGRRSDFLTVWGRLAPGATVETAQTEMRTLMSRLEQEYPETNTGWSAEVVSLHEQVVGDVRLALVLFMGAVGLVLMIACINVAGLMLTRAAARQREMAVRAALGAGRGRITRQLLTESVVLALASAAVGIGLAHVALGALKRSSLEIIPRLTEVGLDPRVLAFTFSLALLTGVLAGLAPALRGDWSNLSGELRGSGRSVAGSRRIRRLRHALVLGEVALALVLLTAAGLLLRSFSELQRVDPGFDPGGVLTARVSLPSSRYTEEAQRLTFYDRLLDDLSARPGVEAVGMVSSVPLNGAGYWSFEIEGRPSADDGSVQDAQPFVADAGYFGALRIPLLQGRLFDSRDHMESTPVALINRTMAERYWPGENPVGARITFGDPADSASWLTIVGVVGDTRVEGLGEDAYPQAYLPHSQFGNGGMFVTLRTAGDPMEAAPVVRSAVRALDADLPVYDVMSMAERASASVAQPRVGTYLLVIFAGIALLLAAVGIYGLISYSVAQRTSEIGVRMALGARAGDVLRLMVREGMAPALAGVAVGVVGAFAATRLMRGFLYGVSPSDPVTFAAVVAFLAAVALVASYLPARRAARVDPMVALRNE